MADINSNLMFLLKFKFVFLFHLAGPTLSLQVFSLVDVVPSQSDDVCYGHPCRFTETIGHCFGFSMIF